MTPNLHYCRLKSTPDADVADTAARYRNLISTDPHGPDEARHLAPTVPGGPMSDMASKYRAAARNARDHGDEINAAWSDEQADWHDADSPNGRRVKAAIERLESGHDCV